MKTLRILSFVPLLLLFLPYSDKDRQFKEQIIGEWKFTRSVDITKKLKDPNYTVKLASQEYGDRMGFIFYKKGVCENRFGYSVRVYDKTIKERITHYLGTKTNYKIENGKIKIFDLSDSTWQNIKIHSISENKLILQMFDSHEFMELSRANYKLNPNEHYGKIIFSSSSCYGTCPISDISIDNTGKMNFSGQAYNTKNGFFTSKINEIEYLKIEESFKKSNVKNLKNYYSEGGTDQERVSISFINDDKIIKTTSVYGYSAPPELFWAYTNLRYYHQNTKLIPLKLTKPTFTNHHRGLRFETKNQICILEKSEGYFLQTELLEKGKVVNQFFKDKYVIQNWNEKGEKEVIYSDGRFYKFINKKGIKIIDLGYNFLINNNLIKKFRLKNEDDTF